MQTNAWHVHWAKERGKKMGWEGDARGDKKQVAKTTLKQDDTKPCSPALQRSVGKAYKLMQLVCAS